MNTTKRHGIYKTLTGDTIYNSQVATLVFLTGIAFKLSAAPGILSEDLGSSAFWAFLCYSLIDVFISVLVFLFVLRNGDALLTATNNVAYRLISLGVMCFLTLKGIFLFSYASSYLTHELFQGLEPSLIYLLFLLPVVYLGAKGISSLSRTAEIMFPVIFLMIAANLVFLQTKMDFARVLPVFSKEPTELAKLFPRYGVWLGDTLPFLFVRIKNKKLPYITIGLTGTWLFVNLVLLLGVAIYGDALKTVTDLLIRIAGFNQLSKDIGRTEWTNLLSVLIASIISLAFTYFGALSACKRTFRTAAPIKIGYPLAILLAVLLIPSAQTVTDFSIGDFGYVMFLLAILLPILAAFAYCLQTAKLQHVSKLLDDEYTVDKQKPKIKDSDKLGILDGFKQEQSSPTSV